MNIFQLLLDTYFGDNDSVLVLGDYCEENNVYFQGLVNADVEESLYHNLYDYYYNGNNDINGNGHGYGYSYSDGNGDGYSDVYHNNNGNGYSYGNGYGVGDGIKEFYL